MSVSEIEPILSVSMALSIERICSHRATDPPILKPQLRTVGVLILVVGWNPAPNRASSGHYAHCQLLRKGAKPTRYCREWWQIPPLWTPARAARPAASLIPIYGIEPASASRAPVAAPGTSSWPRLIHFVHLCRHNQWCII